MSIQSIRENIRFLQLEIGPPPVNMVHDTRASMEAYRQYEVTGKVNIAAVAETDAYTDLSQVKEHLRASIMQLLYGDIYRDLQRVQRELCVAHFVTTTSQLTMARISVDKMVVQLQEVLDYKRD
jgi:hypothetical protein